MPPRRVRSVLQSVFEAVYAFDLEELKKQNIGQAVKKLQSHDGVTSFAVAYVVQAALGGHAIPINKGTIGALVVIGALSEAEAGKGRVPGLERALPKNRGVEAGSLLQQLGVDFQYHPYAPATRKLLLEIAPDCKDRLPKRPGRKTVPSSSASRAAEGGKTKPASARKTATGKAKSARDKKKKKKTPADKKKTSERPVAAKKEDGAQEALDCHEKGSGKQKIAGQANLQTETPLSVVQRQAVQVPARGTRPRPPRRCGPVTHHGVAASRRATQLAKSFLRGHRGWRATKRFE